MVPGRRHRAGARLRWSGVAMSLALASAPLATAPLAAQRTVDLRSVPISRVDTLLAWGRLAAAEQALYAAVEARPRAPEARGALAWYLASRARFGISDVLFAEALRFGADSGAVRRARATIAPWTVRHDGAEVTVPFVFAEDARTIGSFEVQVDGAPMRAVLDPNVSGVSVRTALAARSAGRGISVGARTLPRPRVAVDAKVPEGELRLGLDVLWGHAPVFDEVRGTLTLTARNAAPRVVEPAERIPFVLTMPGLWLVLRPGVAPAPVESPQGRVLLRGARWRVDVDASVFVIER